jgi:hypothetical protein
METLSELDLPVTGTILRIALPFPDAVRLATKSPAGRFIRLVVVVPVPLVVKENLLTELAADPAV